MILFGKSLFIIILAAFLGCFTIPAHAAADQELLTPDHLPANSICDKNFRFIKKAAFTKMEKWLPGNRLRYKVNASSLTGATQLTAVTTLDTINMDQFYDGSEDFDVSVCRYKKDGIEYYFVNKIESDNVKTSKQNKLKENQQAMEQAKKEEAEQKKYNSGCRNLYRDSFCFDDPKKLNGYDIKAVANLLIKVTEKKTILERCSYKGQWFIEKAKDDKINVSLMCADKFLSDIVITVITRAGKTYYTAQN